MDEQSDESEEEEVMGEGIGESVMEELVRNGGTGCLVIDCVLRTVTITEAPSSVNPGALGFAWQRILAPAVLECKLNMRHRPHYPGLAPGDYQLLPDLKKNTCVDGDFN